MSYPEKFKYTKEHEWAQIEGNQVTIGITHHAQDALGDIVFVELPEVGRELEAGETFGVIESIKAVSDLYSPISGKITEVNQALADEPAQLNADPHGNAWIVKMELKDSESTQELLDSKAYEAFVASLG